MGLEYGDFTEININFKTLNKGEKIILQPHDKKFLEIKDPKLYLETNIIRNFQCLTQDISIRVLYRDTYLDFDVKKVEPDITVSTLDTDIIVDFEKPLNYVEPKKPEKKPYQPKNVNNSKKFVPFSGKGQRLGSS